MAARRDRNPDATQPSYDVVYRPPVVRTPSRSRRSLGTLAALGGLAAVVSITGSPESTLPASAAPVAPADPGDAVREFDFGRVAQPGRGCADALGSAPELISVSGGSSGRLDDATLAELSVDPDVSYADLDGDGEDEAVVRVTCDYGANGVQDTVQVWTANWRLAQLVDTVRAAPADVADDSRFPPTVAAVDVDGASVVVSWSVWADDDPHCCPSRQATVSYELDGGLEVTGVPDIAPLG